VEVNTRVLIADDHAVVRRGVRDILLDRFQNMDIEEVKNFKEVRFMVDEKDWDLLILDINMPEGNIIDVLKYIQTTRPRSSTLILSMCPEEQYAIQMLKAGASGYLTKESVTEELLTAIDQIQKGGKYISPSLAGKIAESVMPLSDAPTHETLSSREFQVFLSIASGKTLKQIAEELNISDRTISTYRSRILDKMSAKSNSDLIQYAIHHHLLEAK